MFVSQKLSSPSEPLVPLADLKAHLRVEHGEEDGYISSLGVAAEASIEGYVQPSQICFLQTSWRDNFEAFDKCLTLRMRPLVSVQSVTYIDVDGVVQTLGALTYSAQETYLGAEVWFSDVSGLPEVNSASRAPVSVEYTAGYAATAADARDLIPNVVHAVKLMVGHFYANREAVNSSRQNRPHELPLGVSHLLQPFRMYR